jgi:hypothetical protein
MSKTDLVDRLVQTARNLGFYVNADLDSNSIHGSLGITRLEIKIRDTTIEIFVNDVNPPLAPTGRNYVSTPWEEAETDLGFMLLSYFQTRPISALTFTNQHRFKTEEYIKPAEPPPPSATVIEMAQSLKAEAISIGFQAEIDLDYRAVRGNQFNTGLEIRIGDQEITIKVYEKPSVYCYPEGETFVNTNYKDAVSDFRKCVSEYIEIKSSIYPQRMMISQGPVLMDVGGKPTEDQEA